MTVYFLNNQLKKLTKWIKSYRFIKKREVTLKCNIIKEPSLHMRILTVKLVQSATCVFDIL